MSKGAFHRELAELRRKIATTQDEAGQYDDEMTQLKRQQQQLTVQLDQRQVPATPTHSDLASSVSVCLSVCHSRQLCQNDWTIEIRETGVNLGRRCL